MDTAPSTDFAPDIVAEQPANTTILVTGLPAVWIQLPNAGNLWVAYEYEGQPATAVFIWHQGGPQTPVNPGYAVYGIGTMDGLSRLPAGQPPAVDQTGLGLCVSPVPSGE